MAKFSIGIDFGTQSGRAVLVNVETGEEVATSVKEYTHGVMDESLPDGTKLPHDWALQHPQDYIEVLATTVPDVLKKAGVSKDDVIGIGIDFTACTMLPIKKDGTPLCELPKFKSNPHAYVKLWKHHAAQKYANRLNRIAQERGEKFCKDMGERFHPNGYSPKSCRF